MRVPQHTSPPRPDRLEALFRWYLDDRESGWLNAQPGAHLISLMLHEVADRRPSPTTGSRDVLASNAARHIRIHFQEDLNTAAVATALGFNPDYLGRAFRKAYGMTLTEAIHQRRIRHASHLLRDTSMTIDEISRASGYADPGYFRRMFKRVEGTTPGKHRRLYARVHVNTE